MTAPRLSGLRLDEGIVSFEFSPSIGILARDIDKLGIDIRSFREPLTRAIKEVMIPSIKKNFDAEGRPSWEPLSEATMNIRGDQGSGGKILDRSGRLKRRMQQQTRWTITEESASIQDLPQDIWYGRIHQEGLGGIRTRVGRTLKANPGMSPAQASKRVMANIDRDILSGKARTHSTSNIPARPFVMFQDEDIDGIYEVFQTWLEERAIRAGWVL